MAVSFAVLAAACGADQLPAGFESALGQVLIENPGTETEPDDITTAGIGDDAGTGGEFVAHAGFDLALRAGSWWEYGFSHSEQSYAQGSGSTRSDSAGRFRISLGAEQLIQGVKVYEVRVTPTSGDPPGFDVTRWRSIGADGANLVGSADGSTLDTVLAAAEGVQAGGGFFGSFNSDELLTAANGRLENEFVQADAVVLRASFEEGRCEYFASVGNICTGERDSSFARIDYFEAEVGPLGYSYTFNFEDCGGGFCSGASERIDIGLLEHSLDGEGALPAADTAPNSVPPGFVTLVDDTGSLSVDVPSHWADIATDPTFDDIGAKVPTIVAAVRLGGFMGSYAESGIYFQAVPTEAPDDLVGALDTLAAEDSSVCTTGQTDGFSGPDHRLTRRVLLDCAGTETDLVWIVGELDRVGWTVVIVIQLAAESDQDHLETIITSLHQIG